MSHKWNLNGLKFNFCIKCGTKKSWAGKHYRCMSKHTYEAKVPHIHKEEKPYPWSTRKIDKCKVCGILSGGYGTFAKIMWSNDKTGIAYIPYKLINTPKGVRARYCSPYAHKWDNVKHRSIKTIQADVAYWPIFCALTEDEAMIKDIIL